MSSGCAFYDIELAAGGNVSTAASVSSSDAYDWNTSYLKDATLRGNLIDGIAGCLWRYTTFKEEPSLLKEKQTQCEKEIAFQMKLEFLLTLDHSNVSNPATQQKISQQLIQCKAAQKGFSDRIALYQTYIDSPTCLQEAIDKQRTELESLRLYQKQSVAACQQELDNFLTKRMAELHDSLTEEKPAKRSRISSSDKNMAAMLVGLSNDIKSVSGAC